MAGSSEAPALRRALGKWDLTAIGVNQVIGSAIFLLPADVAKQVGPWGPLAFMAVGLLSLSIALCFAEVGSRFETTGGPYLPARAAFGRFVGFEVGWMMWFARVTSHASVVNGLTLALAFYWPALAAGTPRAATITALTAFLTWINVRGIKQSSWFVNALTIGKLLPLAIFIIGGIWFIDPTHFSNMPDVSQQQISAAAILLIFAYGGYEVTGVLAGEASNPRKDVPFAFVACLIIVSIVMSLTSLVATGVLADVAATRTPLADGAAIFLGRRRRCDDLDWGGHLDDRQQHGPAAEWLAHHLRAGRERRLAALVRQGPSGIPHAVERDSLWRRCRVGSGAVGILRRPCRRQCDRPPRHVSRRLPVDARVAQARSRNRGTSRRAFHRTTPGGGAAEIHGARRRR